MTDDPILPISDRQARKSAPIGRPADLLATLIAILGAVLSLSAALWFFLGFAENDRRLEHLSSAFVLSLILFSFAIGPFFLVALFGRRAYKFGAKRAQLLWTLFLMLPWVVLGIIAITHTPLPSCVGAFMAILAGILSTWAAVSLALDRSRNLRNPPP